MSFQPPPKFLSFHSVKLYDVIWRIAEVFVLLDEAVQNQLQIIHSKCLKPVETGSVLQVFENPNLPSEKSCRITVFLSQFHHTLLGGKHVKNM